MKAFELDPAILSPWKQPALFWILIIAIAVLLVSGVITTLEYIYHVRATDYRTMAVAKLITTILSLTVAPTLMMCIPYIANCRGAHEIDRELGIRKRADQMLHQLVEAAPDAIVITTAHGHINLVNRQAECLFARNRKQMIGRMFGEFVDSESCRQYEQWVQHPNTFSTSGPGVALTELSVQLDDGFLIPVEAGATSITTHEGAHLCVSLRDISLRKQYQKHIESMNAELSERNQDLQQFAYAASHDLQEPLRKIEAFGALLADDLKDTFSDQSKDYLQRMISASKRMRTFINDLLTYSRASTSETNKQLVNLNDTLANVLSDLGTRLDETRGTIHASLLPWVEANPTQMHQLFQNVLSNALKFHRDDIPPDISITCSNINPNTCCITISDNGIGIDRKYTERIFGAFQRLHGLHHYEGSGIGLALCRRITDRHGGSINASPGVNQGAVFEIQLPLAQSEKVHRDAA